MTHIDPKAPGKSPRHPANFRPYDPDAEISLPVSPPVPPPADYEDGVPFWIAIESEPIPLDALDSLDRSAERWSEYDALVHEYGTDVQRRLWHEDWASWSREEMPTLTELREKNKLAQAALTGVSVEVKASGTPDAASDLEAKLAALKAAGL